MLLSIAERLLLNSVIELIRSLDPRPGSQFGDSDNDYVIPDLVVRHTEEGWRVELNPDAMPRLRIQPDYAALIKRADKSGAQLALIFGDDEAAAEHPGSSHLRKEAHG